MTSRILARRGGKFILGAMMIRVLVNIIFGRDSKNANNDFWLFRGAWPTFRPLADIAFLASQNASKLKVW